MIVGLHGKIGAGKNEAAKRLALLSAVPVVEVSFAAKLKESAAAVLGVTVDDLERWKNNELATIWVAVGMEPQGSQTVRSFLQRYGTEGHRNVFGQDFWVEAAMPIVKNYDGALYVATDVRFQNEADRIRELDGIVVGLIGPNADTGTHASELEIECDAWIDNTRRNDNYETLDRGMRYVLASCMDRAA